VSSGMGAWRVAERVVKARERRERERGIILAVGGMVGLQLGLFGRRGAVVARWLSFMQYDERQGIQVRW
jgi:hypothetical protein